MQNIFPFLEIKYNLTSLVLLQHETIFSVGKSFIRVNPCACFVIIGIYSLDKLNLNILPIEVNIIKFSLPFETKELINFTFGFNLVIVNALLVLNISSSNKTFLNLPSELSVHK